MKSILHTIIEASKYKISYFKTTLLSPRISEDLKSSYFHALIGRLDQFIV
jgi:hypothetical protein